MGSSSTYSIPGFSFQAPQQQSSEIDPTKDGLQTGAKNALSWGLTGFQTGGIWGAAAGVGAGAISGFVKAAQSDKLRGKENRQMHQEYSDSQYAYNQQLDGELAKRAAGSNAEYFQNVYAKKGGKIPKLQTGNKLPRVKKKDLKDAPVLAPRPTMNYSQNDPEFMFLEKYNTDLDSSQMKKYTEWIMSESKKEGRDIRYDRGTYDTQGYWLNHINSGEDVRDGDGHAPDVYKKPNHPTFSDESQYASEEFPGGKWGEDGAYFPAEHTKRLYDQEYYAKMFGREPGRPEHLATVASPKNFNDGGSIEGFTQVDLFMEKLSKAKADKKVKEAEENVFRAGGSMNVIPKGVTHEEMNLMGDKGIPVVVMGEKGPKKVAEVELNEIIFSKNVSTEIEGLVAKYNEDPSDITNLLKLGKMIKTEILENTVDRQGDLLKKK